jgi:hypothetical protein
VSGRAGIELTPTVVRLVRLAWSGGVTETVEIPWDSARPAEAIAALRAKVGRPDGVSLAIGLGFLEITRLDLPPVPALERARMVELEPDRYFAAANREAHVVTVAPDEQIAFAAPAALVESWLTAFEQWTPVEWVEPSPVAVARALEKQPDATYLLDARDGEIGLAQLDRGRLVSVRRTLDGNAIREASPIPAIGSTKGSFAAALGAAKHRSHGARTAPALAPEARRRRIAARHRAAIAMSAIAAIAAIAFATWSADRWRERTLTDLQSRAAQAETRGAAADTALRMLRSRETEAAAIRDIAASRPDPFGALAAISAALPREANVLSARATGNNWQIDGTTSDASALVPLLDRHERFDSVRFLSASSRYRDSNRSYETFSIALLFRP